GARAHASRACSRANPLSDGASPVKSGAGAGPVGERRSTREPGADGTGVRPDAVVGCRYAHAPTRAASAVHGRPYEDLHAPPSSCRRLPALPARRRSRRPCRRGRGRVTPWLVGSAGAAAAAGAIPAGSPQPLLLPVPESPSPAIRTGAALSEVSQLPLSVCLSLRAAAAAPGPAAGTAAGPAPVDGGAAAGAVSPGPVSPGPVSPGPISPGS